MLRNRQILDTWATFIYEHCEDPQNPLMHTDSNFRSISTIYQMCNEATSYLWFNIDPDDAEDYWETVKVRVCDKAVHDGYIYRPKTSASTKAYRNAQKRYSNRHRKTR